MAVISLLILHRTIVCSRNQPLIAFLRIVADFRVCKIFGVCPATLWTWHNRGYLRHVKFGSRNMYPESSVKAITHERSKNVTVSGYCRQKAIRQEGGATV